MHNDLAVNRKRLDNILWMTAVSLALLFIFMFDTNCLFHVSSINLRVKERSLTAVVGQVGNGKSSLLSAMLGEMEKLSGRVNMKVCRSTYNILDPSKA